MLISEFQVVNRAPCRDRQEPSRNHAPEIARNTQWTYARHRMANDSYLVLRDDNKAAGSYAICDEASGRYERHGLSCEQAVEAVRQWLASGLQTDVFAGAEKLGLEATGILLPTLKMFPSQRRGGL